VSGTAVLGAGIEYKVWAGFVDGVVGQMHLHVFQIPS
jgi:hypothetical protein